LAGFAVLALTLFGSAVAGAQDQQAPPDQVTAQNAPNQGGDDQGSAQDQNPPGMGRVSMIRGNVSTQRGDSGDVVTATLNTPVAPRDKVATGADSRAEVQLDYANTLRLADNSSATVVALDAHQIQIQFADGLGYYSQFKGGEANVEIDTPNVAIHPAGDENGFSIFVNSAGQTEVTVRKGELEMTTPQGSTRVRNGQMITVQGTGDQVQYKITDAGPKTDWDAFNQDRDRLIQHADSWKHTNHYYTGSQDLDPYGKWTEVPDYGQVWVPNQGPGWAPYSEGSWVWEPYWGWTWASYEPWGWAPYHYGRWFVYGGGWAWWPGPVYGGFGFYRPIWAPAYVSFFGFGPGIGIGIGFGFGSFGWLPIGPGDFFHPWWGGFQNRFGVYGLRDAGNFRGGWGPLHAGDRFSNVRNVWTNDRIRQGFSTVSANGFGRGPVHATPASLDSLRSARGMTGNLPVVPSHESLSASGKFESGGSRASSEKFFSTHSAATRSESFAAQASHLQNAIQRDGHFSTVSAGTSARDSAAGRSTSSFGANSGAARGNDEANRPASRGSNSTLPSSARGSGFSDRPSSSSNAGAGTRTQTPASSGFERFNSPNGSNGASNAPRPSSSGTDNTRGNPYSPNGNAGSQRSSSQAYRPSTGYGSSNFYRPPLQMNRPMVTPRTYGNSSGYGRPSGAARAPSRPSGGNRAPAPSSHGSSHPESHGGGSHPSGGSHGGGGHHGR
ncbi:MAG TPA: DUF6600 domain-containing protein, partial [Candidatus Acidoferrales bacterium]|nr:DUF6600 domain-containing protein [Candidatus Acidoferrales bacterium]